LTNAGGKKESAADVLGAFAEGAAAAVDAGAGHDAEEERHRRVGALDLAATINQYRWIISHPHILTTD
jgi:hypothetical protein